MRKADYAATVKAIVSVDAAVTGSKCTLMEPIGEVFARILARGKLRSVRGGGIIYLTVCEEMRDGAAW